MTKSIAARVQVNVPFSWLVDRYLPVFLERRLHPEIGIDAFSLERFGREDFVRVARQFQEAGLSITLHAPFHDMLPGALDRLVLAATRRRLKEAFALLDIFRPLSIVCHIGYESRHYAGFGEQWLAHSVATWEELAAQAAQYHTKVSLENVYEPTPDILVALFSRLQAPNLQLCLDVGHLQAFGGGHFEPWLKVLWPYIGQLHLHDNHGQADEHLAIGAGIVPFAFILNFLADKGLRPLITLEPHEEGSLEPSLAYLRGIWPW